MRRFLLPALLCAAFAVVPTGIALAACPDKTTCEDIYFPSGDGTMLHADLIRPQGTTGKLPTILSIGPYFAHSGQQGAVGVAANDYDPAATGPDERFKDMYSEGKIFERGYAYVQVDLRGFGASAGCNDFGGKGEQADAKAAVEWAASQDWSNGRVGMWGKSYDGWTQVMAMNGAPKGLAATVIQSPIIDGYRTLYMNGVHYGAGWYNTPALYQSIDATALSIFESPEYIAGAATGTNPACYALNVAQQNAMIDGDAAFWDERELRSARGSSVPTLWSHGFLDANTKPDNFLPVWETLKGPKRAWFGQYTHVRPQDKAQDGKGSTVGREGFIDEAMRWMDRYVKGVPADQAAVESDPAVEVEDGATKKYRAEAAWPPADGKLRAMTVNGGTTTNQPGNNGEGAGAGAGIWSVTDGLPHDVHMAGSPRFTFTAASPLPPRVNVHGILYDISKGKATLISRGAYAVTAAGELKFDFYPQDWTFKKGNKIGFLIAPSDDDWFLAPNQGGSVAVSKAKVELPLLTYRRSAFLKSRPSEDEQARPAPFDVAGLIEEAEVAFDLPSALIDPPAVTLPAAAKPHKLTVRIARSGGRALRVRGAAPTGMKLLVRLQRAGKAVAHKRAIAKGGRYALTFKNLKRGRYRALVSGKSAGATIRVRSRLLAR